MLDRTDAEIIRILKENARMQWREVGELVHMTGQAVGSRIRKLEDAGIIEGYTVRTDAVKMGLPILALVTVIMKTQNHKAFGSFVSEEPLITEAYRISGEGCYHLRVQAADMEALNGMLERLLVHGNYRLQLSIGRIK